MNYPAKITLINYTQNALELLLYTKNTRLQGEQTLQDIINWPEEKKLEHLAYMKDTIQSSWEFVNYTFHIENVTRAFTHQLVRTRTGRYAQQSQRTVDVSDSTWLNEIEDDYEHGRFDASIHSSLLRYKEMIQNGVPVQQARGVLPTNVHTEIIAQLDLRTLHNMGLVRLCTRTQGEYQFAFKEMLKQITEVHPWAKDFIKVHCAWYGTCCFPRYTECPVQDHTLVADDYLEQIESIWENTQHEAIPVAKDGRTM